MLPRNPFSMTWLVIVFFFLACPSDACPSDARPDEERPSAESVGDLLGTASELDAVFVSGDSETQPAAVGES
ncbi:MAG: hypothetical protein ACI92S_004688 [Planctomycetaceae bacterium]|jgi:hypothetical protein